jgi:NADH-quinone oxidoreductase subunit A
MSGVPHCHISIINTIEKLSAYECGLEPVGDARMKFEILYYVIGILYLIFDLEIIFLFPLAALLLILSP